MHEYIQEGNELDEEVLSDLSPYLSYKSIREIWIGR
ncbi:hypothetical protein ABEY66_27155 [Bacillus pseudomycoides]|nr:hypothetical protein [Bacillus pseudomycoides]